MHYSDGHKKLYVVDNLDIKVVDPDGSVSLLCRDLKDTESPFEGVADHHYVYGMWTNPGSLLYVALFGAQKVVRIDPEGQVTTIFRSEDDWSPCGGLYSKKGDLWIMEFSRCNETRVRKVNPDGEDDVFGF